MSSIAVRLAKWKLHQFYARHPGIAKYLPPTKLLTPESLKLFMEKYRILYIKGSTQHTGVGIIKAWKTGEGYNYVKVRGKVNSASSIKDLYHKIRLGNSKRTYIVQKAIDLARIQDRPFDIRVMMMRDGERKWQYAGMVAKVAGPGSVVSNVRRGGGYVTTVDDALRRSLGCSTKRIEAIKKELVQLSRSIMAYSENYPFYSYQCGIDLAVDKRGKVWIIEVNLHNPSHGLFNKLKDKTFFRRVRRLNWSYFQKNKRTI